MTTISRHVSNCEKLISCGTTPIKDFATSLFLSILLSNTLTDPDVLLTRPQIIPMAVDFPAPFGPSSAKKSPWRTFKLTLFNAVSLLGYIFVKSFITSAVIRKK